MIPMCGHVYGTVKDFNPVAIHGDQYYDTLLHVTAIKPTDTPPAPDTHIQVRIPNHLLGDSLQVGMNLEIYFLMKQVNEVKVVES